MMSMYLFFFKQKTAYEMRISDWSSDVCSSDLSTRLPRAEQVLRDGTTLGPDGRTAAVRPLSTLLGCAGRTARDRWHPNRPRRAAKGRLLPCGPRTGALLPVLMRRSECPARPLQHPMRPPPSSPKLPPRN